MLGMKKLLSVFVSMLLISSANAFVNRQNAVVTLLDKASGKTHHITLPVGTLAAYDKLSLLVRTCKQTDPFQPENAYMFIEIAQNKTLIFSGWMNKNEPGQNPLQNADYDLWLVSCE